MQPCYREGLTLLSPSVQAVCAIEKDLHAQDLEAATRWVLETAVPLQGESTSPLQDRRNSWLRGFQG